MKIQKFPAAKYLLKTVPFYDPKNPGAPEELKIPASPTGEARKPQGS